MPGLVTARRRRGYTLLDVIKGLGLSGGLKLCLDAGDAASLPAASTQWLDRSGGGYDFHRGSTSGADASDPAINGTAGRVSSGEYLSFDGGDYLTYETTNPTWINNLHKDNAVFSVMAWCYFTGIASAVQGVFGTSGGSNAKIGVEMRSATNAALTFNMRNGSGSAGASEAANSSSWADNRWTFVAMSIDEALGTNNVIWQTNSDQRFDDMSYSSPSASDATHVAQIGAIGNNVSPVSSGGRIAMLAAWEGAGTFWKHDAQNAVFNALRGRFSE
jgi:hypothetical protein